MKKEKRRHVLNGTPGSGVRVLTGGERSALFARQQRRTELNTIETEARRRVENVHEWAAKERAKVNEKYHRAPASVTS